MARTKKTVKRQLADGTVKTYTYSRAPAKPSLRTVEHVAREYECSPGYVRLKPGSKRVYQRALRAIVDSYGLIEISKIKRRHVEGHRDSMQRTPALANQLHMVWTLLLQFAVNREYIPYHPALRIKKLDEGEHARWPDDLVERAVQPGLLPEHLRRAVVLAVYTGQREGDCIKMTWADYDGSAIGLVQEKTGARVWVPCHSALRLELDRWKEAASATTILTRATGQPWGKTQAFCDMFSRHLRERDSETGERVRPEFNDYVFHGLRKVAAARLAEAGCSVHEIAAITGHATLSMIEHYTREADQRNRASAAITKLENWRKGK